MSIWKPSYIAIFSIFFLLCFIPTNIFFIDGIDSIVLLVVTPLLLLFSISKYPNCLSNKDLKLYYAWFVWVVFTCFTAINTSYSLHLLKTITGGVMMSLIYYLLSHNRKILPYLYAVFVVILFAEIYYASTTFVGLNLGVDARANDEKLNANGLAYMTFYSICSIFFLGELTKNNKLSYIFKIAFFLMVPVAVFVSFITASRQVLPTSLSAWLLLFVQRYFRKLNFKTILVVLIIGIVGYYLYNHIFESLYSDSLLALRTERTDESDTRFLIIKEALQVSSGNLIFGIGPGNFVHVSRLEIFSHNSFVEILVSSGLLGLILYIAILYRFLRQQIRRYRITKDTTFYSLFLIGLIWSGYNLLYVFYVGVYLIPFLFLMMGHSDSRYNEMCSIKKRINA